jgi:hypothetical protein
MSQDENEAGGVQEAHYRRNRGGGFYFQYGPAPRYYSPAPRYYAPVPPPLLYAPPPPPLYYAPPRRSFLCEVPNNNFGGYIYTPNGPLQDLRPTVRRRCYGEVPEQESSNRQLADGEAAPSLQQLAKSAAVSLAESGVRSVPEEAASVNASLPDARTAAVQRG